MSLRVSESDSLSWSGIPLYSFSLSLSLTLSLFYSFFFFLPALVQRMCKWHPLIQIGCAINFDAQRYLLLLLLFMLRPVISGYITHWPPLVSKWTFSLSLFLFLLPFFFFSCSFLHDQGLYFMHLPFFSHSTSLLTCMWITRLTPGREWPVRTFQITISSYASWTKLPFRTIPCGRELNFLKY